MSRQPINLSPDLKQLEEDGYEIEIQSGHLILHNVPYVNAQRQVKLGKLVSVLDLAGDVTTKPKTHVAMFAGEHPCDRNGNKLRNMEHGSADQTICDGLVTNHSFSCKPREGYSDYFQKMTTYVAMISSHAEAIDPNVTARTCRVIENDDSGSPFNYVDNASSRAGISAHTKRLKLAKLGIIGLGGTGSYVLDLVVKTPVSEINLFDGDWFLQHNAFRSPGAPTIEELREKQKKVHYFQERYAAMHRNVIPHDFNIDETNAELLRKFDFVFLCMDGGRGKKPIIQMLEEFGVPFIDVGMGIENSDDGLRGILRVTTSTTDQRAHVWDKQRVPFSEVDVDDVYSTNIQVADLNALNASLAVVKWKKLFGFYADLENEYFSTYTIDGNKIINEDQV